MGVFSWSILRIGILPDVSRLTLLHRCTPIFQTIRNCTLSTIAMILKIPIVHLYILAGKPSVVPLCMHGYTSLTFQILSIMQITELDLQSDVENMKMLHCLHTLLNGIISGFQKELYITRPTCRRGKDAMNFVLHKKIYYKVSSPIFQ